VENLSDLRARIRAAHYGDEGDILCSLMKSANLSEATRERFVSRGTQLIELVRIAGKPGLMEVFLAEYGLSTSEGVALMCLSEALLRVPDTRTIDELIEDKIAPSSWSVHLGQSSSPLVNASTWALMLTGKVLREEKSNGLADILRGVLKRLGEPVIRSAVKRSMQEMGNQFVLGQTINEAIECGAAREKQGYTFSYDMLGEASLTASDAKDYFDAYANAITTLSSRCNFDDIRDNPGISIKLSALFPRYEQSQHARVMSELVERTTELALMAKKANMGFNIDAEEANRLELSLDVIEAVLRNRELVGWDGFGVVVQAYGRRASGVIDWLYLLACDLDRKIMVRLVKGAYWDTEIKRSQVEGIAGFPVFTHKAATDVSYICCAKKLLTCSDRIYPQFATHNAHTVVAILEMASNRDAFEFQRLHGMGEALYDQVQQIENTRCRIYAPVGPHRDLLAYLVRRLLENGANSSFVNQIVDINLPAGEVAADPFSKITQNRANTGKTIRNAAELFGRDRVNSSGWDLSNVDDLTIIDKARAPFSNTQWQVGPIIASAIKTTNFKQVFNPANSKDMIGHVGEATIDHVDEALTAAQDWNDCPVEKRAAVLYRASQLFEANFGELFAVLIREAGKTPSDAIAELREAVDFLRYYGNEAKRLPAKSRGCGIFACISPWNFPLAIFTGQIAAALAAGNGVLAKPAEPTPITASIAIKLLHEAGVPREVLQFLPGRGDIVGAKLTSNKRIKGVCFTGSTATAQSINKSIADDLPTLAPLIAETGGINAMIVDSTALLEQAVADVMTSAFQSAGQRCSALRILYVQEDIATPFLAMLSGAMDELVIGNPWAFDTDIGPVITVSARDEIESHIGTACSDGRLIKRLSVPKTGCFVGPAIISVAGIKDLDREVFGPVLHVATFRSNEVGHIIDDINKSGYGLTFGLHTRLDDRVEQITSKLNVGNIYVNRNQIGAIVGSQPFGGEGLSGTGPKAGGPNYVRRFTVAKSHSSPVPTGPLFGRDEVQSALDHLVKAPRRPLHTIELPGPTGESNRLSLYPRGVVLCLGPTPEDAYKQAVAAREAGCSALLIAPGVKGEHAMSGFLTRKILTNLEGFKAVALWSDDADLRLTRQALAARGGAILPLIATIDVAEYCAIERHVCVDTTAAGGNVSLMVSQA